ncbi:MotA/TolQ/ExbB proton channel family protein [Guyparkeria halophila]|uniref:Biopolymer transport protein ExbB n=1 Tax=Guyparkeria halophila TaxID=47960 RepID=A0ABZ0Z009_9GAMM|nr:MotA/TolQ/ExbB proton channel family protein [Guyparkeria halophila]WQH16847.1 MotA/TolQ/ExbB proton channel family protein [Guyparkeria halophila]
MDILLVFDHGDAVLVGVFVTLLIMSLATWAVAATKLFALIQRRRATRHSMQVIAHSHRAAELEARLADRDDPTAALAQAGLQAVRDYRGPLEGDAQARQRLDEALIRGIRQALDRQETRLQAGQLLFATVGSLAPFVGLFGTVWGIYGALIDLSSAQSVSMGLVAGPLGEALVATAAGLAAAIPAVLFFNLFNRSHRLYRQTLDAAAHDVHSLLMHDDQLAEWARRSGKAASRHAAAPSTARAAEV